MKLTKAIVDVLKYHGYMTFTESAETFLKRFNTVEELGDAGFITDRGAVNFLKTIFDEDGVNRSAEVSEEELNKQAFWDDAPLGADNNGNLVYIEDIEPDHEDQGEGKVEDIEPDEEVNEQGPSGDVVDENPTDDKKEETEVEEPEPEPEPEQKKVNESEPEQAPEPAQEHTKEEEVKHKKTTTRKSTKKES